MEVGVLSEDHGALMRQIAGYRNGMVHFYHEVSQEELYSLAFGRLKDNEAILEEIVDWMQEHPDSIDHPPS